MSDMRAVMEKILKANDVMNQPKPKPKLKTMSLRITWDMWKQLRQLQTEGKIKSIQSAVTEGLRLFLKKAG